MKKNIILSLFFILCLCCIFLSIKIYNSSNIFNLKFLLELDGNNYSNSWNMDNITIQWSENTWIWLSIDYSWSFINNFDNIYEAWSSWTYQKIVTETKRHLKKIWDNYYQYTFFEEWKYSPITITFENNWNISFNDIEERRNERWESRLQIDKLNFVWTYHWLSLRWVNSKPWNYSLVRCYENKMSNKYIPYWTGILDINEDKIYYYNNHITWWSYIDLSKFINHITTYMDDKFECIVDISKISDTKLMNNLPFIINNNKEWEIAIIIDKNWNFWCESSSWKWNIELLIVKNNFLCSMEIHWNNIIRNIL